MIRPPVFPGLKVGDKVLRQYRGRPAEEVEIVRVGRKYLTVKLYSREYPYDKVTGRPANDRSGIGDRLVTPEILAFEERLDAVFGRLQKFGIDSWRIQAKVDHVETLEAVADALEADR